MSRALLTEWGFKPDFVGLLVDQLQFDSVEHLQALHQFWDTTAPTLEAGGASPGPMLLLRMKLQQSFGGGTATGAPGAPSASAHQEPIPQKAPPPDTTSPGPLTEDLHVIVSVGNLPTRSYIESRLAGLEKATALAKNVRSLMTKPEKALEVVGGVSGTNAVIQFPFDLRVHRTARGFEVVCEVGSNDAPSPVMSVRFASTADGAPLNPEFNFKRVLAPERIHVTTVVSEQLLATTAPDDWFVHVFMLQLLGGTNRALPKLQANLVRNALQRIDREIVRNDTDTQLTAQCEKFVEPLANDTYFDTKVGHKGVLLWGPPGTSKTTLSGMLETCGFHVAFRGNMCGLGNAYQNSLVGNLNALFDIAAHFNHIPVLVCAEEVEPILRDREKQRSTGTTAGGGGQEQAAALTSFLDNLTNIKYANVFFIGTTNKFHDIDRAVIRPYRIDIHIYMARLSPSASHTLMVRLLRSEGHDAAARELEALVPLTVEFEHAVFNLGGTNIAQALNKVLKSRRGSGPVSWAAMQTEVFNTLWENRPKENSDASAVSFSSNTVPLRLEGAASVLQASTRRAIAQSGSDRPLFQSTMLVDSMKGVAIVEGYQHGLHLPFRILNEDRAIPYKARFKDVMAAVVKATRADFSDVIDMSSIPSDSTMAAFVDEKIEIAKSGIMALIVNLDDLKITVKRDTQQSVSVTDQTGSTHGGSEGGNESQTHSRGETATKSSGHSTNFSGSSGTTIGHSQGTGSTKNDGLLWDDSGTSTQQGTHSDATTNNSQGYDQHDDFSKAISADQSNTVGKSWDRNWSVQTSQQVQKGMTTTVSINDPSNALPIVKSIVERLHDTRCVVALISSEADSVLLKWLITSLSIAPPLMCRMCGSAHHDPTRLLLGPQAVPCCHQCFTKEIGSQLPRSRVGVSCFDPGSAAPNFLAVLRDLQHLLPALEAIEVVAVPGYWPPQHPTVQSAVVDILRQHRSKFPSLRTLTLHSFGDTFPETLTDITVNRVVPQHLLTAGDGKALDAHRAAVQAVYPSIGVQQPLRGEAASRTFGCPEGAKKQAPPSRASRPTPQPTPAQAPTPAPACQAPKPAETPPVGLPNLGNTCYANAVLQLLLPLLRRHWALSPHAPSAASPPVHRAVYNMACGSASRETLDTVVNAVGLARGPQHDAHEFLLLLLQGLEGHVTGDFASRLATTFTAQSACTQCYKRSSSVEKETCISAALTGVDLEALLANHQDKQKVQGICEHCHARTTINRVLSLLSLSPLGAFIHLKRFDAAGKKIISDINVPLRMRVKDDPVELGGFIVHVGDSVHGGHCVAYIRHNLVWYKCDDERCEVIDFSVVLEKAKQSYLLYFEKASR